MPDPEHVKKLAYQLAHRTKPQVYIETGVLVVLALTALIGNSCVLYVFYKSPRLRNVTNYYLITLAISDIVFALTVMPLSVANSTHGRDVVGHSVGQVSGFICLSLIYGSLQTTSLIAVNRFFCVVKPLVYRKYFKPKPAILMIVGSWILSVSFVAVVYFGGLGTFLFYPGRFVYFLASHNVIAIRVFTALSHITFIIYPMLMTAICYWKVYQIVKRHETSVSTSMNNGDSQNYPSLSREEIHVTKSVLALVCGFVVCWIPCSTTLHIAVYISIPRYAEMIITYTAFASSALNPFVFNIFNKPFRKEFFRIFSVKKTKVGSSSQHDLP
ncbi:rhodopsin, GQ-coupled-like [Actinia tenebrosa]|uniref:Rhodopsin, GQ-coupled-like n=1 Tax=Actinia tenebrosa TaxID=6105 RepID=A0A6P8IPG2_ACTTE|nr:rhodopsin, GQ-coupled-like [Actinia tenebrosa]